MSRKYYAVTGTASAETVLEFSSQVVRDEYVSSAEDGGPWRQPAKVSDMIFSVGIPTHWHSYAVDYIKSNRIGCPPKMAGGKAVKVYLDSESIASAIKLGNGNVSEGIRKALKQAGE